MVNEACEGQRQERLWCRLPAIRYTSAKGERRTEPSTKHACSLQSFHRYSLSGTVFVRSRLTLRHSPGQISGGSAEAFFTFYFFYLSFLLSLLFYFLNFFYSFTFFSFFTFLLFTFLLFTFFLLLYFLLLLFFLFF